MNKKDLSLTRQSQILILGRVISFAFNFMIPIVVVRYLDMTQYGMYKQLFMVFMTLSLLLPFGIIESLYYFIPRNREEQQHYISQTVWFLFLTGSLFVLLFSAFGKNLFSILNLTQLNKFIIPLALYVFLMCLALPLEKLLLIEGRVKLVAAGGIISEVSKGICIITATVMTRDLRIILYALLLFSAIRVAVFAYYLFGRKLFIFSFRKLEREKIREHVRYSFAFGLSVVIGSLRRFLDQYFVSYLFSAKDFAVYAVGCFQLPLLNLIYETVSNVVLIRVSEYEKEKNYKKILEVWVNSCRELGLIYFPATLLFIVASREFITVIFTESYAESVPIFIITLLQLPFNVFITHSILKAFAENRFILNVNVVLLLLTALLVYLGIHFFGMIGASAANLTAYGLRRIAETIRIKRIIGVRLRDLIPWRIFMRIMGACLSSAIPILVLKSVMHHYLPIQMLVLETLLFSLVYIIIIYFSGLLNKSEKEEIRRFVNKVNFLYKKRNQAI